MNPLICAVGDCDRPAAKRGLCNGHYIRWNRYGDALPVQPSKRADPIQPGETFGRLTVIGEGGWARGRDRMYLCRCICGEETTAIGYCLKSGNTRSCGCLRRESCRKSMLTHGHTAIDGQKSPTYQSWRGMLDRCKKSHVQSEWYADRGITVAPEWRGRTGFAAFLEHMGERTEGMTLDRIDPDGNYEPGNCRWATGAVQAMNKRPRARLSEIARLERLVAEQATEIARLTKLAEAA